MASKSKLHLVTGGSGFLGTHIVRRLVKQGHKVRVLDLWPGEHPKGVEVHIGDICNKHDVAKAIKGVDTLHHVAALVPITDAKNNFAKVNIRGVRVVAQAAIQAKVKHVMEISSSAIYGGAKCPITEQSKKKPVEEYGQSKLDGERLMHSLLAKAGVSLTIVRPRAILGPGRLGIFQILFEWVKEGKNVYTIGSGRHKYQFVHVDDLIDAYMLLLSKKAVGDYNVGATDFGTLRSALLDLVKHAGTGSKVKALPKLPAVAALRVLYWLRLSPLTPWHYLTYHKAFYFDTSKIQKLGWKPKYSNTKMIQESYDWFLKHGATLKKGPAHSNAMKQKILKVLKFFS